MRHPFTFACVTAAVLSAHATTGAQPPYADTEWTTIHATSRNNDYVPTAMAERYERKWKVLLVADVVKMPGSVAVSEDDLPAGLGEAPPPGLWEGGLMDPDMIDVVWYVFEGVTPGANTPAVEPTTGRIYNTGFSEPLDDNRGALYGFDFIPGADGELGTIAVAFDFVMGAS